jgi:hypothetical protein
MTPRDPKRVDRMIELLREAWQLFPDQRLTQLVINIADKKHDCGPVFYADDTDIEKKLEAFVKERREYLAKKENEGRESGGSETGGKR